MYKFAVIEYDVVQNIIIADTQEIAEAITGVTCVQTGVAGIGWIYDSETGEFSDPLVDNEISEETIDAIIAQEESNTP